MPQTPLSPDATARLSDDLAEVMGGNHAAAAALVDAFQAGNDEGLLAALVAATRSYAVAEASYDQGHTLLGLVRTALVEQVVSAEQEERAALASAFGLLDECQRQFAQWVISQLRANELAEQRAALEQQVAERSRELAVFKHLVALAPDGITIYDGDGFCLYANGASERLFGLPPGRLPGRAISEYVASGMGGILRRDIEQTIAREGRWAGEMDCQRSDGSHFPAALTIFPVRDDVGRNIGTGLLVRDISDQRAMEEEQRRLQDEVIAAQQAALRELSTPLISVAEGVVIMPLVGAMDSARAEAVIETLLTGVGASKAHTAILDITGVPVVDTQVANALLRAAQAVRLLGAQVILTGIRPEIAQTIVQLGISLGNITSESSLQAGLARALRPNGGPRRAVVAESVG